VTGCLPIRLTSFTASRPPSTPHRSTASEAYFARSVWMSRWRCMAFGGIPKTHANTGKHERSLIEIALGQQFEPQLLAVEIDLYGPPANLARNQLFQHLVAPRNRDKFCCHVLAKDARFAVPLGAGQGSPS